MPNSLGLFYAKYFGYCIRCTFIFRFFCLVSKDFAHCYIYKVFLCNANNLQTDLRLYTKKMQRKLQIDKLSVKDINWLMSDRTT